MSTANSTTATKIRKRSCLSCRWLRRGRSRSASRSQEAIETSENSTSDRRNNASEDNTEEESKSTAPHEHTTTSTISSVSSRSSSWNEITLLEQQLLRGARECVGRYESLQRSGLIRLFLCFVLCAVCGLCLRSWAPSSDLQRFLRDLDLVQYHDQLQAMGFDHLADVVWANEADLVEAGVTLRAHRRRILRNVEPLRAATHAWFFWLMCTTMAAWTVTVVSCVMAVLFHKDFRTKCMALGLWLGLTVGCRIRMYRRVWKELDVQRVISSTGEINPVD